MWDCILLGKSQPVGRIVDYWRRVEVNISLVICLIFIANLRNFDSQFQMRETPHVHSLVCIAHDGITSETAESSDPFAVENVKSLIKRTISAKLVPRHPTDIKDLPDIPADRILRQNEERDYNWSPHLGYFCDATDPRRDVFDPRLNYYRLENSEFEDCQVQTRYRRLQLANQIHRCCFTCFKYITYGENVCRFHFPWEEGKLSSSTDITILTDRDKKKRVRLRLIPERNNAH